MTILINRLYLFSISVRALRAKQREELKLVAENPELAKELNKNKKNYSLKLDLENEEDEKFFAMERGKF